MKIDGLRVRREPGFGRTLKRVFGKIEGRAFEAVQYEDTTSGQHGAHPLRWRVWWVGMSKGEKVAISRELNKRVM